MPEQNERAISHSRSNTHVTCIINTNACVPVNIHNEYTRGGISAWLRSTGVVLLHPAVTHQSKVWTHLLIPKYKHLAKSVS